MNSCYKCHTTTNLTKRKQQGTITRYICSNCRRHEHDRFMLHFITYRPWSDDWQRKAEESYARILARRAILKGNDSNQRSDHRRDSSVISAGDHRHRRYVAEAQL